MAISAGPLQLVLIGLCFFSLWGTWGLIGGNGALEISAQYKKAGLLPGTTVPARTVYTGVPQIDGMLVTLNGFFWQVLDGSTPAASLHSFQFGGQIVSLWSLAILDGLRQGNKGRVNSYVLFWGLACQLAALGNINPILLSLSLLNTAMSSPSLSLAFPANPVEALTIPLSLLLGFVLPSVAMSFPAPYFVSYANQQGAMAIWQAFPLWTTIFQQFFKLILPRPSYDNKSQQKAAANILALRIVYGFSLLNALATQIATLTLTLTAYLFPMLFHPTYATAFAPRNVFLPASITTAVKMQSVGAGTLQFLQYDEIVGCSALVLYVGYLLANKWTPKNLGQWVGAAFGGMATLVLAGPGGLAVALIWARDEIVYQREVGGKKGQ